MKRVVMSRGVAALPRAGRRPTFGTTSHVTQVPRSADLVPVRSTSRGRRRAIAAALLAAATVARPAAAQATSADTVANAARSTSADAMHAAAHRHGSAALWAGAGALLAGAVVLDRPIERSIPYGGGPRWKWATKELNYGGRPQYPVVALGVTYLGARLVHAPKVADAAEHIAIALLASGAANGALKVAAGRERPSFTDRNDRFRPFDLDDRWQSFPSGHAIVAFSLAASISEEARRPSVTAATYGSAALVGWSRVYDRRHWTSDVVAGALVGAATSRYTVRWLHAHHRRAPADCAAPSSVSVTPLLGGVMVRIAR